VLSKKSYMNVLPELHVLDDNNCVLQTIPSYYIPIFVDYKAEKETSESEPEEREEPPYRHKQAEMPTKAKQRTRYERTEPSADEDERSPRFADQERRYALPEDFEASEVESNQEEGEKNITFRRRGKRSRERRDGRDPQVAVGRENLASHVPPGKVYKRREEQAQPRGEADRKYTREARDYDQYEGGQRSDAFEGEGGYIKERETKALRGGSKGPRRQQQKSKETVFELEVRETNPVGRRSRGLRYAVEGGEHLGERSQGGLRSPYLSPQQRNRPELAAKISEAKRTRDEEGHGRTRDERGQEYQPSDTSLSKSRPKRRIWEIQRSNEKKRPQGERTVEELNGERSIEGRAGKNRSYLNRRDSEVGIGQSRNERKRIWHGKDEPEWRPLRTGEDLEADWRQPTGNRAERRSKSKILGRELGGSRSREVAAGGRDERVGGWRREHDEGTRGDRRANQRERKGEEEREQEVRKRPERREAHRDNQNVLNGQIVKESKTVTKISFSPKKDDPNDYDSLNTISEFINLKEIIEEHSPARIESSHEKRFSLRYTPTN
jgi:hypothetical protein